MSIIDFTTAQRQYYNMTPHDDDDDDQIIFAFLMGMKMTVGFTGTVWRRVAILGRLVIYSSILCEDEFFTAAEEGENSSCRNQTN